MHFYISAELLTNKHCRERIIFYLRMNLYRKIAKKEGARATLTAAIIDLPNTKTTQDNPLFRFRVGLGLLGGFLRILCLFLGLREDAL